MARHTTTPLKVVLPHDHPRHLQIQAALASAKPPGDLINHGGAVLASVELTTVFVGSAWSATPLATLRDELNAFFDDMLGSTYISRLSIYGVGTGRRIGTVATADPTPKTMTDADLRAIVTRLTQSSVPPNANTLIALFTPPGTVIDATAVGAGKTCIDHCAYHDFVGTVPYAALPYLDCTGCVSQSEPTNILASLSRVASHEVCEAITDPFLQTWFAKDGEEIGDLCNGTETPLGPYVVQQEWINGRGCS